MESKRKMPTFVRKMTVDYRPILILIIEIIAFTLINNRFLAVNNLTNILKQISINAILAAGVSFAILLGGIDISVGSVAGFTGAIAASLITQDYHIVLVLVITLGIGLLAGAFNGFFVSVCRLQPMIVTLASMSIFRGATLVYTNGKTIRIAGGTYSDAFRFISTGNLFGVIPMGVVCVIIVFAIVFYVQNMCTFGRHIYAIGGNEEAAHLSGINVVRTKFMGFVMSGLLAGFAGIVLCARVGSAQPTAGDGYEMDAIAACVVGGISLRGGEGKIMLALVGAIIIGMMNNLLNLMNVSSYWQTVVKGAVILLAVLLDMQRKNE